VAYRALAVFVDVRRPHEARDLVPDEPRLVWRRCAMALVHDLRKAQAVPELE
jgi:hypothetical protein